MFGNVHLRKVVKIMVGRILESEDDAHNILGRFAFELICLIRVVYKRRLG